MGVKVVRPRTERFYASLAPGAARELPNILERFVREATVQNENQVRTERKRGQAGWPNPLNCLVELIGIEPTAS